MNLRILLAVTAAAGGKAQVTAEYFSDKACTTKVNAPASLGGVQKMVYTKVTNSTCFTQAQYDVSGTSPKGTYGTQISGSNFNMYTSTTCTGTPMSTSALNGLDTFLKCPPNTCTLVSGSGVYTKISGTGFDPSSDAVHTCVSSSLTAAGGTKYAGKQLTNRYFTDKKCTVPGEYLGMVMSIIQKTATNCIATDGYKKGKSQPDSSSRISSAMSASGTSLDIWLGKTDCSGTKTLSMTAPLQTGQLFNCTPVPCIKHPAASGLWLTTSGTAFDPRSDAAPTCTDPVVLALKGMTPSTTKGPESASGAARGADAAVLLLLLGVAACTRIA